MHRTGSRAIACVILLLSAQPVLCRLDEADEVLLDGDHRRAADLYARAAAAGGPVRDAALVGLGTARRLAGDDRGALTAFDQVLAGRPRAADRARAVHGKVQSLARLGRWREAAALMREEVTRLLSPGR